MTIAERLRAGKLEQTCPDCGRWEAAGSFCTGCSRPTGPDDWYANGDVAERERRGAVRDTRERRTEKSATPLKRGRGRPSRASAHNATPTSRSASDAASPGGAQGRSRRPESISRVGVRPAAD